VLLVVWNGVGRWWVGSQAHCWGSETSGPGPGVMPGGAVGLWLFDFWIVDASIARIAVSPAGALSSGGGAGGGVWWVWVFVFVVCVFVVFVECLCLASCKGHMVDALASRADEGRWSLR
jgi:hypothetical protein